MLDSYIKWFRSHERIMAVVIILAVIAFLGNKYLDKSYDSALAKNAATQQVLTEQIAKNADTQKQYAQLLDTVTRQNQSLVQAIAARTQNVAVQQKTDASLALPELALRHQTLLGVSTGVQSTENGFLVQPPVELLTVQKLESLPVLEANNRDQQTVIGNKDQQITGLNGIVDGLKLQMTDANNQCQTQIKFEQAKARKSKLFWFKAGAVVGYIGGVLTGHYL